MRSKTWNPAFNIWSIWLEKTPLSNWAWRYCLEIKYYPEIFKLMSKGDIEFYYKMLSMRNQLKE